MKSKEEIKMLKIKTKVIRQSWTATYYKVMNEINKEYGEEILPHPREGLVKWKYDGEYLIIEIR